MIQDLTPGVAKMSELEHTLSQMEVEKESLSNELRLAENEFVALMENVGAGKIGTLGTDVDPAAIVDADSPEVKLKKKIGTLEEENEFLCDQIQALLTLEVELEDREKNKDEKILDLEKRYAKMEERYLKLQDKLDAYQQSSAQ